MASGNPLLFIFNEVSARVPAATVREGCMRMNESVRAVATMMDGSSATLLNIKGHDIWSAELTDGYTVSDWVSAAESDFRKLLFGLTSKIKDLDNADECLRDRFYKSEFAMIQLGGGSTVENVEVLGLGAAFIFSGRYYREYCGWRSNPPWKKRIALRKFLNFLYPLPTVLTS